MKVKAILILLSAFLCFPLGAQNIVTLPQNRQEILDKLTDVLAQEPVSWPDGSIARVSPFQPVEAPPPTTVATRPEMPQSLQRPVAPRVVAPTRLSDHDALRAIVPNFKPRGTIVMGKGRMLTMPNRKRYREGQTLSYRVHGEIYKVVVEKVTIDGYTLRLGSARAQRSFKNND